MTFKSTLSALALLAASPALADCGTVRFSDVGWTDIAVTLPRLHSPPHSMFACGAEGNLIVALLSQR